MALDRSGAYIFGKNCIISPVLKQKWPKKKDIKTQNKMQFLEKGIFGSKWVVKRNKKERIRSTQYVRSHFWEKSDRNQGNVKNVKNMDKGLSKNVLKTREKLKMLKMLKVSGKIRPNKKMLKTREMLKM